MRFLTIMDNIIKERLNVIKVLTAISMDFANNDNYHYINNY